MGGVIRGDRPPPVAAMVFQGANVLIRAIEQQRKMRETEELAERIARIEEINEQEGA